ncbi:mechanosensitive ion channel [Luedemannella flava]|uniref:Mechanosensitive ion channel n=1 Tax=Luedemannella flava TaxID=349316 RepID=A0ABN2MCJ9_9ACTN
MPQGLLDPVLSVGLVLGLVGVVLGGLALARRALRRLSRRVPMAGQLAFRAHRPARAFGVLVALAVGGSIVLPAGDGRDVTLSVLHLALVAAGAWLLTALLFVVEESALARFRTDVVDNRRARTVHTQVRLIRRVTAAVITVLAVGAMLLTIPGARALGTSLLASAGLVGVVAALAAQSLLGNVLAGLQLAFGGSLRLDDVVIVEGEWGRIEELTLTYVVVQVWDDRRLIVPTSYFTTKPFQNWTRTELALLGTVELDVDWAAPVERLRAELREVVSGSDLWDGRVSVLQVTDAVGGNVRLRALVSAADAPKLWDLRCLVRERLITWLREYDDDALPRTRTSLVTEPAPASAGPWPDGARPVAGDARVFGGDAGSRERARVMAGRVDDDR